MAEPFQYMFKRNIIGEKALLYEDVTRFFDHATIIAPDIVAINANWDTGGVTIAVTEPMTPEQREHFGVT